MKKLNTFAVVLCLIFILDGCTGSTRQGQNTAIGAGVGAVGGALLTNGNALGVVGGAVVGGVVGHEMTK